MPTLQLIPVPCHTPVIELIISGAKHKFIIDTGATHTILSNKLADGRKWTQQITSQIYGIGEHKPTILRVDLVFHFCGVYLDSVALSDRMDYIKLQLPFPIAGLIGQDILSQFSQVCFDYKNKVVRFGV